MNALYENPGSTSKWLKFELVGIRSNRGGLGARIHVRIQTPDGNRSIHRTVGTGGSFGGNPIRQELGLGYAESIESLTVYWPTSGTRQIFTSTQLDQAYRVHENAESLELIRYPSLSSRPRASRCTITEPGAAYPS